VFRPTRARPWSYGLPVPVYRQSARNSSRPYWASVRARGLLLLPYVSVELPVVMCSYLLAGRDNREQLKPAFEQYRRQPFPEMT
jgi:hypothetical protein